MTEDISYYKECKNEFGEMLKVYKEEFISYSAGSVGKSMYEQSENKFIMGMNYLVETMLLTKCHCLCACCVSSTVGVLLMAEKFEYIFI